MNGRILRLAVPSILANVTVPLVGMVDIGVSGRLGNVAAIGSSLLPDVASHPPAHAAGGERFYKEKPMRGFGLHTKDDQLPAAFSPARKALPPKERSAYSQP